MPASSQARRGLTIIEVIVVVSILAILAGVLIPSLSKQIYRTKLQAVVEDLKAIETASIQYYADVGSYLPLNDIGGFSTAANGPTYTHFVVGDGQPGWNGPYLSKITDPSPLGGHYDIDVIGADAATIDLGTQTQLSTNFQPALERINEVLDGDGNLTAGVVWGDSNGIHYGINYVKLP